MATTTYGTEYVQSSDLVSNWPGSSLSVANRIDDVSLKGNGLNNQTGTSYTLVLTDGGKLVTFSNAAAVSLTVPTNASVAFPTGVSIKLTNKGAGTVTVAGAGGVTLNGNQLTIAQNRSAMLYKLDTNTWVMTTDPSVPSDPGLAYITASTFSASTAVNVNNCFTTTYDNYLLMLWVSNGSAADLTLRMRLSGTDATTNYNWINLLGNGAAAASTSATGATSAIIGYTRASSTQSAMALQLYRPALAAVTSFVCNSDDGQGTAARQHNGAHTTATAYDGLSLIPSAGTITGTLRVYGYRNS